MKTKYITLTLMFITASLLLIRFSGCTKQSGDNVAKGDAHKSHEHEKELYQCPMHPQITSDKPGQTCPICGMNLVKVEPDDEEDTSNETSQSSSENGWEDVANDKSTHKDHELKEPQNHSKVKVSLDKQQLIGVEFSKAISRKLFKSIRAPGRIAFDPELYTAQSEYLEALNQWERVKGSPIADVKKSTREMIRSAKIRLKVLGLSEDQIKSLGQKRVLSEGLLLSGSGEESWVYADIFEMDLPHVKKGLSVEITANFLQGETLAGKVIAVDQVIDPKTRSAKARIRLKKTNINIRPESYVNVTIFAPLGDHLSVPLEAIMDTGRETFVFVKKGKGKFEPRRVRILLETDEYAAIGSGLMKNEEIVVGGNFMLDSESRLKAVLKGANNSSSGHQH